MWLASRRSSLLGVSGFQTLAALGALLASGACASDVGGAAEAELSTEALTLSPRWKVSGGGPVAFSPGGTVVATGSTATQVQLLAADDGKAIRSLAIRHIANAAAFSPDGSLLAVGS